MRLNRRYLCLFFIFIQIGMTFTACEDKPSRVSSDEIITDATLDLSQSRPADQSDLDDQDLDEGLDAGLDADTADMMWRFDLEVVEEEYVERAPPVERLYAGYAERPLGFPIGVATVGFFPPPGGFKNPYAASGTHTQHTTLTARALLLRQGNQSLTLLRIDTIAVWQDFVVDLQRALRARGRGDLADGLIVGATHTHASGGKIINHAILKLLAGDFSPAMYYRVLDNLVEVILEADQNVQPASAGYDTIQVAALHSDRRCENGDVIDHSLGLLKVVNEAGDLMALIVNYAMHATVVSAENFTLSADATGAFERGIEQYLPEYAPVLYFQSWAGDMSPEVPEDLITDEGTESKDEHRDLAAIARGAAELIIPSIEEIDTRNDLTIQVKTLRFPMNSSLVNPDGSFDHYPHGGAYCYPLDHSNCPEDGEQRIYDPSELRCLFPVSEENGITWGHITAVQLGELGMVTLPGEPLTSVGVDLRNRAVEQTGLEQVWVLGYAQGYLGYLLHRNDFVLGGYEGAGAIWGPGLGEFLIDRGVEIITHLLDSEFPLSFLPVPLPPASGIAREDFTFEEALGEIDWVDTVHRSDDGLWTAEWVGGDPSVDTPRVTLEQLITSEQADGTVIQTWSPVQHSSGLNWSSDDLEMELSLRVDPSYRDQEERTGRHFYWRVNMPERFSVVPSNGTLNGEYRWVINGNRPDAYQLISNSFQITP